MPMTEAGSTPSREGEVAALPRAHGEALGHACLRRAPEDFRVDELLGFEPSGHGEHLFLWVRKTDRTTDEVVRQLARWLGIHPRDVSYAGLKDRRAVTAQWFSAVARTDPPAGPLPSDPAVEVLAVTRNDRKLRRGALAGNGFELTLHGVSAHPGAVARRLLALSRSGVPNYFGEQRFGRAGRNVADARALLDGRLRVRNRTRRGLLISAARSWLFNQVLAERVRQGTWSDAVTGDLLMLDGSNSVFSLERESRERLERRLALQDVHPTGPLPGRGGIRPTGPALALEQGVLARGGGLEEALAEFGANAMRRALRSHVARLHWYWKAPETLVLGFALEAGAYATMVVRELFETGDTDE